MLGTNVYDTQGKQIGEINDVVFDENTGGMSRVIVGMSEYLGLNDQLTPLEWNKIDTQQTEDGNLKFVVRSDKAQLMTEKSFAKDHWPDFNHGWTAEMPNSANVKLVRLSQANDAKLFDQTGHQIGGIKDIMIDTHTGKVAFAAISFDDQFINQGDKLTMVPWKLVRQSEKETAGYVLHADKSKLEGATFFSPNEWPNMHDMTMNKQVYDYYAVSPYYWIGA